MSAGGQPQFQTLTLVNSPSVTALSTTEVADWATAGAAIIALLALLLTWLAWREARRSADAADRSARAADRSAAADVVRLAGVRPTKGMRADVVRALIDVAAEDPKLQAKVAKLLKSRIAPRVTARR